MIIRDFIDTQATEAGLLTQQARLMFTIVVLMLIAPTARIWPNAKIRTWHEEQNPKTIESQA